MQWVVENLTLVLAASALLLLLLLVIASVKYHRDENWRPTLRFLGTGLVAIATAIGVFVALHQWRDNAARAEREFQHRRVEVAFRFIRDWEEQEVHDAFLAALKYGDSIDGLAPKEADEWLDDHPEAKGPTLGRTLDLLDKWGLAVRRGFADGGTLCEWLKPHVTSLYDATAHWIRYEQTDTGSPRLWEEFLYLGGAWTDGCPAPAEVG